MKRVLAYVMSLVVAASAVWMPTSTFGQTIPGSPFGGSSGGGTSLPVADTQTIVSGSSDATKLLRFEVDGFTTGTTRVVTFTNADQTVACIGCTQTFTAANTFSSTVSLNATTNVGGTVTVGAGGAADNGIVELTASTPDTGGLVTGTTSNHWVIAERADASFDFAHALTTHPTLFVHSTNQSTTEFTGYSYLGPNPSRNTVTVNGATTFAVTSAYIVLECTGAETINTITGGLTGTVLHIENSDTECTIADDDSATATDAVDLTGAGANDVGAVAKVITLIYNGTHWLQTAESDN